MPSFVACSAWMQQCKRQVVDLARFYTCAHIIGGWVVQIMLSLVACMQIAQVSIWHKHFDASQRTFVTTVMKIITNHKPDVKSP